MTLGATLLPLRGLVTAGREVGGMIARRTGRPGRSARDAALAAITGDDWALVTGASSGIGRAYAELLAARGANVLLVADDGEGLDDVATAVSSGAGLCDVLAVDLSARTGVDALVTWIGDRRVSVLVNNAGIGVKGPFCAVQFDSYVDMIGVNLVAPVLITRALLPAMLARGLGAVIHVSSINALAPMPRSAVYSATKAFVFSYATALWSEHRDDGVVFQTVLPGTTATAFHDRQGTRLPPWAMQPRDVAEQSLAALGGTAVFVPGSLNRVLRAFGAALPLELRTAAAAQVMTASLGDIDPNAEGPSPER